MSRVPHNKVVCSSDISREVQRVLRSGRWAQGQEVQRAERSLRWRVKLPYAACVASGTAALRLALRAIGVGRGDRVLMPAYSCVALPNAVLACGALPVAIDVLQGSWVLNLDEIDIHIRERTPRAIIGVHAFGHPMDLKRIAAFEIPFIEDCSHGFGFGMGSATGISILSFYATKFVGAGEGGAVLAGKKEIIETVRDLRNYADKPPGRDHLNEKMTDIEAAVVCSQLGRLTETARRRTELARRYVKGLAPIAARRARFGLPQLSTRRHWYRFCLDLKGADLEKVRAAFLRRGIQAERPITPWLKSYRRFPVSGYAYENVLSLPCFPAMSFAEQDRVIGAVEAVLG